MEKENYVLLKDRYPSKAGDVFKIEAYNSGYYMNNGYGVSIDWVKENPEWFMKESEWKEMQADKEATDFAKGFIDGMKKLGAPSTENMICNAKEAWINNKITGIQYHKIFGLLLGRKFPLLSIDVSTSADIDKKLKKASIEISELLSEYKQSDSIKRRVYEEKQEESKLKEFRFDFKMNGTKGGATIYAINEGVAWCEFHQAMYGFYKDYNFKKIISNIVCSETEDGVLVGYTTIGNKDDYYKTTVEDLLEGYEKDKNELKENFVNWMVLGKPFGYYIKNKHPMINRECPDPEPPKNDELIELLKSENKQLQKELSHYKRKCKWLETTFEKEIKLFKDTQNMIRHKLKTGINIPDLEQPQPDSDVKELIDLIDEQIIPLINVQNTSRWVRAIVDNYKAIRSRLLTHKYTEQDMEKCFNQSRIVNITDRDIHKFRRFSDYISTLNEK